MAQFVVNKCKGLYSFPNKLKSMPDGALITAENIVINREDIIEPRRGFKIYGNVMGSSATTDIAHNLFIYKNRLLRHFGTGSGTTLQWDGGTGTFTSFSGTFAETTQGLRIKGIEVNGNFYFTTSSGIKKISAASAALMSGATIGAAGGVKALDGSIKLNSQTGFFTQDSIVSYRVVWGIKDKNNNLILGYPSERIIISNPTSDLLISDFNGLLTILDTETKSGGINDGNYVTTLKVPLNSSPSTLRTNLIALGTKLDTDTVITEGVIDVSTSRRVTATSISLVFSATVASFLSVGDKINITGSTTSEVNNNVITITSVSTTTVVGTPATNYASTDGSPVADTGAAVKRLKYTLITSPITLSSDVTTAQLESMQDYYDAIVTQLQSDPSGIATAASYVNSASTQSATTDITFTIPTGITTDHFYQIYRTNLSTSTGTTVLSDLDPGDEHKLAYEANPTSAEITAGTITVQDIVPESFLGANLYTNPTSGEGIAQANEVPPYAKDIQLFKGFTFYANTKTKHRLDLSLLSISDLISGTSTITITDGTTSNTYTFISPAAEVSTIVTGADTANSLNGKYFYLNSAKNATQYYIWIKTSGGVASDPAISGKTGIRVNITTGDTAPTVATAIKNALNQYDDFTVGVSSSTVTVTNANKGICTDAYDNDTGFTISVTTQGAGENYASVSRTGNTSSGSATVSSLSHTRDLEVGMYVSGTGIASGSKILSKTATTITLSANATATGTGVTLAFKAKRILLSDLDTPSQQVDETARSLVRVMNNNSSDICNSFYLSGPDDVPGELLLESKTLDDTAFYVTANSTLTGGQFNPSLPISGNTVISTNEVSPNRIYYSKKDQPEAVPLLNYQDVGPKDKSIVRVVALRDSLFVFKEEGVYRLSGDSAPFSVSLFDSSTIIKGADTPAVLNNQIYLYSSQGVATVSDTGISVISRPIEDLLVKLTKPEYTFFSTASWGCSYESDRAYYLSTVSETTDTKATQIFRYNTFTSTWTIWSISKTCGIVNPSDDKLYFGAGDINYIEQERKSFDRTDYADREYSDTISAGNVNSDIITVSSLTNYAIGDILYQLQYLTISEFNRLLKKLDGDTGVTDTNYFSLLGATGGSNLRTGLTSLATKLDADTGVADTNYASTISAYTSSFSDTQLAFNAIVNKLNADTTVGYSNYSTSDDTTEFEVRIIDKDIGTIRITTEFAYPFIVGPTTIYKKIDSTVEWAPQVMGDPSMGKHARESTIMFEKSTYTTGTMSFATDLDPNFQEIEFNGSGNGSFGNSVYGNFNYGGDGNGVPFRTLIPRQKARCRYLNIKFNHAIARELYSIYGISITAEQTSERMYR